jgi:hypothetical protein
MQRDESRGFLRPALAVWAAFVVAGSTAASAQPGGLAIGAPIDEARQVAAELCTELREVEVTPPSFPLAREHEVHLVCRGWATPGGEVDRAAFVFADGSLAALEARGGAVAALAGDLSQADSYLHYRVFADWHGLADPEADAVWLLSDGARHLNLFTWANPVLTGPDAALPAYEQSAEVPALLDFGTDLDTQLTRFEAECPLLEVARDRRVWLPNQPGSQTQVNCFGYEYGGFPRKLEAVYGDGRLHVVWILTGRGEEDRLRQALIEAFGDAISVNEKWEVFADGRVGLRKDKPEVLLLSEEIAPLYRSQMGLE